MDIIVKPRSFSPTMSAMGEMEDLFNESFKKLRKTTPGNHAAWKTLENGLVVPIYQLYIKAYSSGCQDADVNEDVITKLRFRREAQTRATTVCGMMRDSTLRGLGIQAARSLNEKKQALTSGDRSAKAAAHESVLAFYHGKSTGWKQNRELMKRSVTSGDHDIDDMCDDNEDDGWIGIGEAFQSGDFFPPYHINCECSIIVRR